MNGLVVFMHKIGTFHHVHFLLSHTETVPFTVFMQKYGKCMYINATLDLFSGDCKSKTHGGQSAAANEQASITPVARGMPLLD